MKRLLVVVALSLSLAPRALGWGDKGHKLIADVAAAGLGSSATLKVQQLLGGKSMAAVALWADEMRTWQTKPQNGVPPGLQGDLVAKAFHDDHRNDSQPEWHFTDPPVGVTSYHAGGFGTKPDDVAQTIKRCVRILKHQAPATENITDQQALRLLIHYVGDIHQPLHAASGYWVKGQGGKAVLAPPAQAKNGIEDRGGNSLKYGPAKTDNLHIFWDGHMVDAAQKPLTRAQYLQKLITLAGGGHTKPWTLSGNPLSWPEQWAGESAATNIQVYHAVKTGGLGINAAKQLTGKIVIPPTYVGAFTGTVNQQLARAGFRLAATLNAIWP